MSRSLQTIMFSLLASVFLVGCVSRGVAPCGGSMTASRMPCGGGTQTTDSSGRWNETDAKRVADEMMGGMLEGAWLQRWAQEHDGPPAVVVGPIQNETMQHIDQQIFIKDIARNLVNADSVQFVEGTEVREVVRSTRCGEPLTSVEMVPEKGEMAREKGADFMVHGTIRSTVQDTLEDDRASMFYTVNLELLNLEANEKAWLSETEIKKIVDRQKFDSAPPSSRDRPSEERGRPTMGASQGC